MILRLLSAVRGVFEEGKPEMDVAHFPVSLSIKDRFDFVVSHRGVASITYFRNPR
jgi:hypothetical protein